VTLKPRWPSSKGQAPPSGASALTALSDALARGDLSRAKGQVDSLKAQKSTRRDRVEGALAQGAYLRAVGQPEAAAQVLTGALAEAREGGMGVATAQALVGLAIAHSLAGRVDLAVTLMAEAEETAAAAGLLTLAADASVELGLLLVRQGQGDAAAQQATRAKARLEGLQHPSGVARLAELDGALAADRGDTATAAARYGDAVRSFVRPGPPRRRRPGRRGSRRRPRRRRWSLRPSPPAPRPWSTSDAPGIPSAPRTWRSPAPWPTPAPGASTTRLARLRPGR
jgi:hypothetical protein